MYQAILNDIGNFSENNTALFENEVKLRHYQKGQVILQKGDVLQSAFYLLQGSAYQYQLRSGADQNVVDLHVKNDWFLNYKSLVFQQSSDVFIIAYTDCEVLELTLGSVHYLI